MFRHPGGAGCLKQHRSTLLPTFLVVVTFSGEFINQGLKTGPVWGISLLVGNSFTRDFKVARGEPSEGSSACRSFGSMLCKNSPREQVPSLPFAQPKVWQFVPAGKHWGPLFTTGKSMGKVGFFLGDRVFVDPKTFLGSMNQKVKWSENWLVVGKTGPFSLLGGYVPEHSL